MAQKPITEINKLLKEIKGKPMTKSEKALLDILRLRVKTGEMSVQRAHEIWDQMLSLKVLKEVQK